MVAEKTGRTRILLPCGIGDVYWSLVKLRAFCKRHDVKDIPYVAIVTTAQEPKYDGSEYRSLEFLKMVPFVKLDTPPNKEAHPKPEPKWLSDLYLEMWHGTKTNCPGFMGYDYFLVYNGAITNGIFLEEIDDLECEWNFPMIVSDKQIQFQNECQKKYGKYVVYLWSFCGGGYSKFHTDEFSVLKIIKSIQAFVALTNLTPVFVGSWWDTLHGNDYLKEIISAVSGSVDLVGKTDIDQLFGVIKGSEMVVGAHCGPTIMSTVFGKKTIILWSKSYPLFKEKSPLVVAPPYARNETYWPVYTKGLTIDRFVNVMLELVGKVEGVENQRLTDTCLCGSHRFDDYEKSCYHITETGESVATNQQFGKCSVCGIVRQYDLPFKNSKEYEDYYVKYPPTNEKYKVKDWDHDIQVAKQRCDSYSIQSDISSPKQILDVGSGSGAFVYECRNRGQEAYGCELAKYHYSQQHDFIYNQRFESINFPVDYFDLVTCHDVLEHTLEPVSMLKEMFRITKQNGNCIIDFPNFYSMAGEHHWKDAEHVWFFSEDQLREQLKSVGFTVTDVTSPIESKLVFHCAKPNQTRPTVLVPPGLGDSYWSIVKMQSFLAKEHIEIADVILFTKSGEDQYNSQSRSTPFLQMFPFVRPSGVMVAVNAKQRAIWEEAYKQQNRTIFRNVLGCNYLVSYNGYLRVGKQLEEIDPSIACNWYPPMFVSWEQEAYQRYCLAEYGKYMVCYFPTHTTYEHWIREFSIEEIVSSINKIVNATGLTPVFAGAKWDSNDIGTKQIMDGVTNCIDLTGETTLDQLFGLLKGAEIVVGFPSGMTVLSAVFKKKTLIIWNNYYNNNFVWNCVPPDVRKVSYFVDFTKDLVSDRLAAEVVDLLKYGKINEEKLPKRVVQKEVKLQVPISKPPVKIRVRPTPVQKLRPVRAAKHSKMQPLTETITSQDNIAIEPELPAIEIPDLTVLCVLKSGGDYTEDYVARLASMVSRNITVPYQLVCLTDMQVNRELCNVVPLPNGNNGWWAKVEMFKPNLILSKRILYFDLDVVILKNIDDLAKLDVDFAALQPWNPANLSNGLLASGVMMWRNGKFPYIYDDFMKDTALRFPRGDQQYISSKLKEHGESYTPLQNVVEGIYSYKRQCLHGLPHNARIVCFHGRPRPHEVLDVKWIKNYWR